MTELTMKKPVENDELTKRLQQAAGRSMTPEEKREQRISYILSTVGRFDEKTRKEVEAAIDEVDR